MNWRALIVVALFAAAALGVFKWRQRPTELPGIGSAPPEPAKPGYFMNDAHIVQTGADGLPLYRVDAERIRQNPQDLTVRLENLRLDYYSRDGVHDARDAATAQVSPRPGHWLLTASAGVMPPDAKRIELQEGVEIKGQPASTNNGAAASVATIRTSRLSVDIEAQVARTRERVDIDWGGRQLSARGMSADLKAERVKLESAIHGQFIR